MIIVHKALYGLKSSSVAFHFLLVDTLWNKGFQPTLKDLDVHISPVVKPCGFKYYKMILSYVDDIICLSHKATETLWEVMHGTFKVKQDKIEPPDIYLGAQLQKRDILG